MIVAHFASHFGTEVGARLRNFCKNRGVALAWAFVSGVKTAENMQQFVATGLSHNQTQELYYTQETVKRRIIDPEVAKHIQLNVEVSSSEAESFGAAWNKAPQDGGASDALWDEVYEAMGDHFKLAAAGGGAGCSEWTHCLGASKNGFCTCYS